MKASLLAVVTMWLLVLVVLLTSCGKEEEKEEKCLSREVYGGICVNVFTTEPLNVVLEEIELVLFTSEEIVEKLSKGHDLDLIRESYSSLSITFVDQLSISESGEGGIYRHLDIEVVKQPWLGNTLGLLAHEILHYYNSISENGIIHEYHSEFMDIYWDTMQLVDESRYSFCEWC